MLANETPENTNNPKMSSVKKFFVLLFVVLVFFAGVQLGRSDSKFSRALPIFVDENRGNAPGEVDWQILWDTIDKINQRYLDRPVDMTNLLYGAVSGAVASLDDPYSLFLPPKEAEEFGNELRGSLEGIGAEIALKNQQLIVVAPIDDSPAMNAGVKAGDYIARVDGEDTFGMTLEQAVRKIRGPAGTRVTLTIFHKGQTKPVEIAITRARIEVKSLSHEIQDLEGKKIGILKLRRFGEETQGELDKAISEFLVKNVKGVILDLRNNPGGYLETSVSVASNWVSSGATVVIQKSSDGNEQIYEAEGANRLAGMPTVVLINGGSASASEIVAGALRDHGLAKLVGEKSFGKGSVQELIELRGGAELKLTISKWVTPSGHDLNKEGIEPDEKIELTDEDFQNDRDPQMDKALEVLSDSF
ncbi:MAG: S41 family peptidase [bacterium]|nr:S41 family peptidase [bacterium]